MRIGGIASGMDTDQMVRDLMKVQRMPLDKLNQQRQVLQWQLDAFREVNTLMTKFRDNIFDTVMRSAQMNAKQVTSSNTNLVSATATAAASNGSFVISRVDQLATAATNKSSSALSKESQEKFDSTKTLYSQKDLFKGDFNWKQGTVQKENFSLTQAQDTVTLAHKNFVNESDLSETMSVKVNGKNFNVVTSLPADGLKDGEVLFNRENGTLDFGKQLAQGTRVNVTYATESDGHYFTSSIETYNANGESQKEAFAFQGTRTLNQVISEINSSSAGVSMFYDSHTDRVSVQRKETGNFNTAKGSEAEIEAINISLNEAKLDASNKQAAYEATVVEFQSAKSNFDELFDSHFNEAYETSLRDKYGDVYSTEFDNVLDATEGDEEEAHRVAMLAVHSAASEEDKEIARDEASLAATAAVENSAELEAYSSAQTAYDEALAEKNLADALENQLRSELAAMSGNEMSFQGSFFTNVLQLNASNEQGGTNASFTINGLETIRQSNTFTINGVSITLKDTFDNPPITLGVSTDTDKVFDTIMGFVNEYNEMLDTINGKLTEERYRDYKPLTDEQKEAMSEKDIERWEERAMSGMLRRDPLLSGGLDRLRMEIYSPVQGLNNNSSIRQLTDLGITTSKDYMQRGKLEVDESKLREAIERDPEAVFQLFAADGATKEEQGIARRMRDSLQETMRAVSERAGGSFGKLQNHQFTIGRNMNDIDTRITNFERRLQQVEDRYWKQFTAMEKAMHQANSQMEQMWSMLMGNQG